MNIYVSNLSFNVQDEDLRGFFESFGEVTSAKIVTDKFNNNRSKGFGFVEMSDDEAAAKAIERFNGKEVNGRALTVNEARPKESGSRGPGGGYRRHPPARF